MKITNKYTTWRNVYYSPTKGRWTDTECPSLNEANYLNSLAEKYGDKRIAVERVVRTTEIFEEEIV